MAYICSSPDFYSGKIIGTGHCVPLVQAACGAPHTSEWKEGVKVKGYPSILKGTAIATFENGKYPNRSTGNHAAIYLSQDSAGIWVIDQWLGHAASKRLIRFKGNDGISSNDGDDFSVID